jgi:hypothetical protein
MQDRQMVAGDMQHAACCRGQAAHAGHTDAGHTDGTYMHVLQETGSTCKGTQQRHMQNVLQGKDVGLHMQNVLQGIRKGVHGVCRGTQQRDAAKAQAERVAGDMQGCCRGHAKGRSKGTQKKHMQNVLQGTGSTGRVGCSSSSIPGLPGFFPLLLMLMPEASLGGGQAAQAEWDAAAAANLAYLVSFPYCLCLKPA